MVQQADHGERALAEGRAFVDLSSYRKVRVDGGDARDWLHDLLTADVAGLEPGGAAEPTLGTTLRLYDPVERVWRITWLDPSSRLRLQLTARKVGDDIVQVGADPAGRPRRWTFSEIRPTSFVWRSEYLDDDGRSWVLRVECFAKRVARD